MVPPPVCQPVVIYSWVEKQEEIGPLPSLPLRTRGWNVAGALRASGPCLVTDVQGLMHLGATAQAQLSSAPRTPRSGGPLLFCACSQPFKFLLKLWNRFSEGKLYLYF